MYYDDLYDKRYFRCRQMVSRVSGDTAKYHEYVVTYMPKWKAALSSSAVIRDGRRSIWAALETSDITAVKVLFPPPPHASSWNIRG